MKHLPLSLFSVRRVSLLAASAVAVAALLVSCKSTNPPPPEPTTPKAPCKPEEQGRVVVDVGLTEGERAIYYYTAEGSELFPYEWFLALKDISENGDGAPFKTNLERFGMIYDENVPGQYNLPVGMTVHTSRDTRFAGIRMLGVNCAMCHVSEWTHNGKPYRIDGGPSVVDMQSFYGDLFESMVKTALDPVEMWGFMHRLNQGERSSGASAKKVDVETWTQLQKHKNLVDMGAQGEFEKALAKALRDAHAEEMAKDEPVWNDGFKRHDPDAKPVPEDAPAPVPADGVNGGVAPQPLPDGAVRPADDDRFKHFKTLIPGTRSSSTVTGDMVAKKTVGDYVETLRLLRARITFFRRLITRNNGTVPGRGRVDAFGTARNLLFDVDVQPLLAPVSWPHLWDFEKNDWLHWDANTNSITERNVGQALGLGAVFETKTFTSTLHARGICALETVARKIRPPKWPAAFGAIDEEKRARGQVLFQRHCASCHTKDNINTSLEAIGTDKQRAQAFPKPVAGVPFPDAIAPILTKLKHKAFDDANMTQAEREACDNVTPEWRGPGTYAGRPLSGIWASPPYLHNGAVPTLYDLLLPASERPKEFWVGREFDAKKVGIDTANKPGRTKVPTSVPGNFMTGHEYGTQPPAEGGMTDAERWDLVEYMKSL